MDLRLENRKGGHKTYQQARGPPRCDFFYSRYINAAQYFSRYPFPSAQKAAESRACALFDLLPTHVHDIKIKQLKGTCEKKNQRKLQKKVYVDREWSWCGPAVCPSGALGNGNDDRCLREFDW